MSVIVRFHRYLQPKSEYIYLHEGPREKLGAACSAAIVISIVAVMGTAIHSTVHMEQGKALYYEKVEGECE